MVGSSAAHEKYSLRIFYVANHFLHYFHFLVYRLLYGLCLFYYLFKHEVFKFSFLCLLRIPVYCGDYPFYILPVFQIEEFWTVFVQYNKIIVMKINNVFRVIQKSRYVRGGKVFPLSNAYDKRRTSSGGNHSFVIFV